MVFNSSLCRKIPKPPVLHVLHFLENVSQYISYKREEVRGPGQNVH